MTKPIFYINYNSSEGHDPVTCEIGTAKELRISDDIGERRNNEFELFRDFIAREDRDSGGDEGWIERRPMFIAKFEQAKKEHAEWVARVKAAKSGKKA